MDLAVVLILTIELLLGSTAVVIAIIALVITVIVATWLTFVFGERGWIGIPVASIILMVQFPGGAIVMIVGETMG